jgi:hypothetical protein
MLFFEGSVTKISQITAERRILELFIDKSSSDSRKLE